MLATTHNTAILIVVLLKMLIFQRMGPKISLEGGFLEKAETCYVFFIHKNWGALLTLIAKSPQNDNLIGLQKDLLLSGDSSKTM